MNELLFDFLTLFFFLSIFDDILLRNDEISSTSSFYTIMFRHDQTCSDVFKHVSMIHTL